LKSKVGRRSGADLGFWDGFASVLDITLKHKTKVTIGYAVRGFFFTTEAQHFVVESVLCHNTMAFAKTQRPQQR
jgi:hypothetical protein